MTLDARLDVRIEDAVTFAFTVTNPTTERVELTFRGGRTADVVVRAADSGSGSVGGPVWRWSDGRAFTQTLRTEILAPGEEARETMVWEDPEPGSYVAVATLEADGASVHAEREFAYGDDPGETTQ